MRIYRSLFIGMCVSLLNSTAYLMVVQENSDSAEIAVEPVSNGEELLNWSNLLNNIEKSYPAFFSPNSVPNEQTPLLIENGENPLDFDMAYAIPVLVDQEFIPPSSLHPWQCSQCAWICSNSTDLKNHKKTHEHSGKKYYCSECGRAFTDSGNLANHRRIHGINSYNCPVCGKSHGRKDRLEKHLRSHSDGSFQSPRKKPSGNKALGEIPKPFNCSNCGKNFAKSAYLTEHLKCHEDTCLTCVFCGKFFKLRNSLSKHISRVHKPAPVPSDLSPTNFAANSDTEIEMKEANPAGGNSCNEGSHVQKVGRQKRKIAAAEQEVKHSDDEPAILLDQGEEPSMASSKPNKRQKSKPVKKLLSSEVFSAEPHIFKKIFDFNESLESKNIDEVTINRLRKNWSLKNKHRHVFMLDFFEKFFSQTGKNETQGQKNLNKIYSFLQENNIRGMFKYLEKLNFNQKLDEVLSEKELDSEVDINKTTMFYDSVIRLMFCLDDEENSEFLVNLANIIFEHCFSSGTYNEFKRELRKKNWSKFHREFHWMYAAMMNSLVYGESWNNWSEETLLALKKQADAKKRIVYIAGGFDIKQLIKYGVYNIDIIDPAHKSQTEFYNVIDFEWMLADHIGDEISFTFDSPQFKDVVLRRTGYKKHGSLKINISKDGKHKKSVPQSETVWSVFDPETEEELGTIIFHRKYCTQNDFVFNERATLLLSFNELYYVASGEWGIDSRQMDDEMTVFVKQLHTPLGKQELINLADVRQTPFFEHRPLGVQAD